MSAWRRSPGESHDGYGPAEQVPTFIAMLASPEEDDREAAIDYLYMGICHQACTIFEATAPAVPFLIELAGHPKVKDRHRIVTLLGRIVCADGYCRGQGHDGDENDPEYLAALEKEAIWVRETRQNAWRGLETYLDALKSTDVEERIAAVFVLAVLLDAAEYVPDEMATQDPRRVALEALVEQLSREKNESARANLVMALGTIDEVPRTRELIVEEFTRTKSPAVRLAAALRLVDLGEPVPTGVGETVLDAVLDPRAHAELGELPWEDTRYAERLAKVGLVEPDRALPRILECIRTCSAYTAENTAIPLMDVFFERKWPLRELAPDDIDDVQHKLLLTALDNGEFWGRIANGHLPLKAWGLPTDRRALRAFLTRPGEEGKLPERDPAEALAQLDRLIAHQLPFQPRPVDASPAGHPSKVIRAALNRIRRITGGYTPDDRSRVVKLELAGQGTDALAAHLPLCQNLRELDLANSEITDAAMPHIARLTRLTTLDLVDTEITDRGVAYVAGLTELRKLRLRAQGLTDEGLRHLRDLRGLEELFVGGAITGRGVGALRDLQRLSRFSAYACLTDEIWEHLGNLKGLEEITCANSPATGAGFRHLSGLARLQVLNLERSKITDSGMRELPRLRSLVHLNLSDTEVSDHGIESLAVQPNLQRLELTRTKVGDRALDILSAAPSLRRLDLFGTAVGDAAMARLPVLADLEFLDLTRTRVTEASVPYLLQLRGPQWLGLPSEGFNTDAVRRIKDQFPETAIRV